MPSAKASLLAALLLLVALPPAQAQVPRRYADSFNYNGRFYYYQLEPDTKQPGKHNLTISTVSQPNSPEAEAYKVYHTDALLQQAAERITHLRIYAATPLDYAWAVSQTNYMETAFQWTGGRVEHLFAGRKMNDPAVKAQLPETEVANKFSNARLSVAEGVKLSVTQFVKYYNSLFRFPEQAPKPEKLIAGSLARNGAQYDYEWRRDFFNPGDDNLSIRKEGAGLLFNTLAKIDDRRPAEQRVVIDLHYVRQQGLAWQVYANDYVRGVFDTAQGQLTWQIATETAPLSSEPPQTFDPKATNLEQMVRLAIERLMTQYPQAFGPNR